MTFREIFGPLSGAVAILIGLLLGWLWAREQRRKRIVSGVAMDTTDPIWLAALDKARASLPRFRELASGSLGTSHVKYALQTTAGATEHVWGPVVSFDESTVTAGLETLPFAGQLTSPPPYVLQMSQVEDWRVEMNDGRIFGAYTARAQLAYARKVGHDIPYHMLEVEKHLVDA